LFRASPAVYLTKVQYSSSNISASMAITASPFRLQLMQSRRHFPHGAVAVNPMAAGRLNRCTAPFPFDTKPSLVPLMA
jgi:hypothetical protein